MGFIKHTRAEKVEVVKPVDNAKLNVKTASKTEVTLDDLPKTAASGCTFPDCDCSTPCIGR